jgi:hypothetical protein
MLWQWIFWMTFLPLETLTSYALYLLLSDVDYKTSKTENYIRKGLSFYALVLVVLSVTNLNIPGYDYISCEGILGPLWYFETIFHGLILVYFIYKSLETKPLMYISNALIPLGFIISNTSYFLNKDWSGDVFLGFAFIIALFAMVYFDDNIQFFRKTSINIILWLVVLISGTVLGLYSLYGLKYYNTAFLVSIVFIAIVSAFTFFSIKRSSELEKFKSSYLELEKEVSETLNIPLDLPVTEESNTPTDRLADIINNMMLAMPGGQYRKLEFLPHSTAQLIHTLNILFGGTLEVRNQGANQKVLVDTGFLLEMIRSILGTKDNNIVVESAIIDCTDTKMIITINGIPDDNFTDSEEKMAKLMSVGIHRDGRVLTIAIPFLVDEL